MNLVVTRGCDSGIYYSATEVIPDNGCVTRNGEYWCYCSTLPVGTSQFPCNYLSQSALNTNGMIDSSKIKYNIILNLLLNLNSCKIKALGIASSCAALSCLNGGVCSNCNALVGQYYCQCPPQYTGPCKITV